MRKFDKYCQEGNEFLNELAAELGHEEQPEKSMILLKATLHTLRDRISIAESFDLMSQLPLVLKGVFVEHWKFKERPEKFNTFEEFKNHVKEEQQLHGETEFDWPQPTEDLVKKVISLLNRRYFSEGQLNHVMENLPKDIAEHLQEA